MDQARPDWRRGLRCGPSQISVALGGLGELFRMGGRSDPTEASPCTGVWASESLHTPLYVP